MECSSFVHSSMVKDTSPFKTMKCKKSVYSSVVKDTSSSKTMECDNNINNSVVKVVSDTVKSVIPFDSQTVKTGNSLQSDNVETLKVSLNDSDTILTLDLVKTNKLFNQERHYKLHPCCNSCTYCVFSRASAKERSKPPVEKIKIKPTSFISHLYSACSSCRNCCSKSFCGRSSGRIL